MSFCVTLLAYLSQISFGTIDLKLCIQTLRGIFLRINPLTSWTFAKVCRWVIPCDCRSSILGLSFRVGGLLFYQPAQ